MSLFAQSVRHGPRSRLLTQLSILVVLLATLWLRWREVVGVFFFDRLVVQLCGVVERCCALQKEALASFPREVLLASAITELF